MQYEGLEAENTNDQSMVLYMEWGSFTALFMGDAESAEEAAGGPWPAAKLLKTAHHGSRFSTSEAFLSQVDPEIALISAGKNNLYGHPHPELLERLAAAGVQVHCTAWEGTVTLELQGD